MNEPQPERRRFQFGLRKLLLWTAAVALLLGVGRSVGLAQDVWLLVWVGWILAVGIIRSATNPLVAGIVALAIGGTITCVAPEPLLGPEVEILLACVFALIVLALAELIHHAVDWLDNLMQTKTDD